MAIPASVARAEAGFDFINLAPSVHFFNVMAYDLHGIWDDPRIAGAHSDIVGMPAYGRSFTLSDDTCLSLGCPFKKNSNVTAIGKCFLVFVDTIDARTCSDFALFLLFL